MNVLCLVQKEANQRFLEAALYGVGLAQLRFESSWDRFMQAILADRPDLVFLEQDALTRDGANQIVAADWALRAMALPRIVVLSAGQEDARFELEVSTELEHFVVHPFAQDALAQTISAATGDESWLHGQTLPSVLEAEFGEETEAGTGRYLTLRPSESLRLGSREREGASPRQGAPTLEVPTVEAALPFTPGEEAPVDPNAISAFPFGDDVPLDDAESVEAYEALIDQHYRSGASEPSPFVGAGANAEPPARSGPPERISRRRSTPTGMRFAVDEDELGGPNDAPDETGGTPSTAGESLRTSEPVDESEASGAGDPDALPDPVEVRLAPMPFGNLHPLSVAEVLYACAVTASTGRLRLIQGGLRREILFLNGMPGRADATSTQDDIGRLLSTFTWKSGEYVFEEEPISKLGFLPYGDVLDLLYRGIQRFMGMNDLAVHLSSQMRLFPVYTTLFERMSQAGSLSELRDVLRRLDGQTTFERGLMKLGVDPETALRAVYFGTLTGLVVFREEATEAPLDVALTRSRSGAPTTPISSDVRRTELRDGERSVAASVAKTAEASGLTPQQQNALELLRGMERRLATLSEAEALGIPEGTSEDDAQTRFQELIRAYHPDRFASLGNAELHRLANTVFIGIRNAYRAHQQGSGARAAGAGPQRGASSPSGAPGASRVARTATTGPQRAVTSSVTGPQRAVTGADAPESGSASKGGDFGPGRVNDALERLRRATGQHAAVAPREFETGKGRPVTAPGVRSAAAGMTQDQLVRNALRALEGDAVDKAAALVSQCRKKGGGNPLVPIIEAYIAYRQDEISSRKALKVLEEHIEALGSDVVIAQTLTFCGHIQRLEEELDDARRFYQKAAEKDRSNAEATRWIRYLRSRGEREKSSGGFLNKLLNTKITLSGKSK